jgi:hypothetical protein
MDRVLFGLVVQNLRQKMVETDSVSIFAEGTFEEQVQLSL